MSRAYALLDVICGDPVGCPRCGHVGHQIGCRCCQAAKDRMQPGRRTKMRGRGITKSPKPLKRRRRRRERRGR